MAVLDSTDYGDFSLYFLAYETKEDKSLSPEEKAKTKFNRQGESFYLSPILKPSSNRGVQPLPTSYLTKFVFRLYRRP